MYINFILLQAWFWDVGVFFMFATADGKGSIYEVRDFMSLSSLSIKRKKSIKRISLLDNTEEEKLYCFNLENM